MRTADLDLPNACALTARRATHSENFPLQLITNLMCAALIAVHFIDLDSAQAAFGAVRRGGQFWSSNDDDDNDIDATFPSTLDAPLHPSFPAARTLQLEQSID